MTDNGTVAAGETLDLAESTVLRRSQDDLFDVALARPHSGQLVRFYDNDEVLTSYAVTFLAEGIRRGDGLLIIGTEAHQAEFRRRFAEMDLDVHAALTGRRLLFVDAREMLSKFLRNGEPDREVFQATFGGLVTSLASALPDTAKLRAYDDMVDILWQDGERHAALHLEELWDEFQTGLALPFLCAYPRANFYKQSADLSDVSSAHPRLHPQRDTGASAEAHSALLPHYPERVAKEISGRAEVEAELRTALRQLRSREEQSRRNEEQLRDFVENATVALHRVGPDGTILWANRAELELLGYEEREYVGRPITDFHADGNVIHDILARLRRGDALHNYEARLRAKDGDIKHVLISSNVHSRDGQFLYTRCFTRDITERRKAEEVLRQTKEQLQLITDALPVLIAFVDQGQYYRFVSAAYEHWLDRPREELVGRHLEEVLGAEGYRVVQPHAERALAGTTVTYEGELSYRSAGKRVVEATYIPQRSSAGSVIGFVALVTDISERKSFERFRTAAAGRAERLLEITGAIAGAVSSEQVFEALVDSVAKAVGASSSGLWLLEPDGRTARLVHARGYAELTKRRFASVPLDLSPSIPASDSLRLGKPIWISSQLALVERYPHLSGAVTPGRSYRTACLPLFSQGRVLGTLGLTIEEARTESDDERDFLLVIASYAGQAIERLRLLEAERRSLAEATVAATRLGIVSHASRAFVDSNLDLQSRMSAIVLALASALDSCIGIALVGPNGLVHLTAVQHPDPEAQRLLLELSATTPLKTGEGITGSIAATGQSVLFPVIDAELLEAHAPAPFREFLQRFPAFALIGAPLRAQGRVIGTVTATRWREGETYEPQDLHLLEELAERAALAIENSRLYEETLAARTRAEQLYLFAQAVVVANRVEAVFDAAITAIETALGAKRSAVLTFDGDGVMRFRAWHNLSETYRSKVEGHSPWPRAATDPQPVLIEDALRADTMSAYVSLFASEGIGALAFIPLVTRGRLLGKFMVYYDQPHAFAASEVETGRAIANHLASVIQRFAAISKLEETIRHNELFAGALAHDLRNPLSAMVTAAQLVLIRAGGESPPSNDVTGPLSRVLSSGQRMSTMIEQLLDFTRARSGGGIVVQPQPTNLVDLCAQVIGELELSHPEWKVLRESTGDPCGSWDSARLQQVFSNLVANAGQHGAAQAPVLVRVDGSKPEHVRVEVHNQGAIADSLLPHVFDPFRGAQHRSHHSQGLGLGLFIVREIVRSHGGSVDVASSEATGTTFAVQLPRQAAARPRDHDKDT